jgi:hypothetical protein
MPFLVVQHEARVGLHQHHSYLLLARRLSPSLFLVLLLEAASTLFPVFPPHIQCISIPEASTNKPKGEQVLTATMSSTITDFLLKDSLDKSKLFAAAVIDHC